MKKKKLSRKKIAIFKRPQELAKLHALIIENGGEVVAYPLLKFKKIFTYEQEILSIIQTKKLKAIIFTSSKAVIRFFEIILANNLDIKVVEGYTIIAIGEYTAKTLKTHSVKTDYLAEETNQEGVWRIIEENKINDILFPRSKIVRDFLEKKLLKAKINFISLPLYTHITQKITQEKIQEILSLDFLIFTSPLMVRAFQANFKTVKKHNEAFPILLSLGKITHQEVDRCLPSAMVKKAYYPDKSNFTSLVEKLLEIS